MRVSRRGRRAHPARDLPAGVRARRDAGPALDRDVRVQQGQRHVRVRAPLAAHRDPARRVGVRGPRRVRLGRRARPRRRARAPGSTCRCRRPGRVPTTRSSRPSRDGSLDEAVLDVAARRVLRLVAAGPARRRRRRTRTTSTPTTRWPARPPPPASVLLKNDGGLLPLASTDGVAVIGEFARTPRYQGAGSLAGQARPGSTTPLDALRRGRRRTCRSRPGSPSRAGRRVRRRPARRGRRRRARRRDRRGVPRAARPRRVRGRTTGRASDLPDEPGRAAATRSPRSTRASSSCSPTARRSRVTGWRDLAPAILEGWLGGQAGGSAVADLLLGRPQPVRQAHRDRSRTASRTPRRSATSPARPASSGTARASWWATAGTTPGDGRRLPVRPRAVVHDLRVRRGSPPPPPARTSTVTRDDHQHRRAWRAPRWSRSTCATRRRPSCARPRELKAFTKVDLEPGESREVSFDLVARDLVVLAPRAAPLGGRGRRVRRRGRRVVARPARVGVAHGRGRAAVG